MAADAATIGRRVAKTGVILLLVYVGIVVLFESLIGYFQPENQGTLVITTTRDDGSTATSCCVSCAFKGIEPQVSLAIAAWAMTGKTLV